ncbi:1-acyl-sn-glycerol-3-phosphate acyltransferase alpha-like [Ctenocephalides felis]|uniref:1-acyl-sn-glycerol-3-phosphate acyltransferase alpha-like n=1 Tax=Ctenocephalides felis TaxID=7515 RepID=UPI000E6E4C13|nr:1-acyl-sn-glycerol-3-phosphate acyltransferase alpha-like [Ctenocephalides felis]
MDIAEGLGTHTLTKAAIAGLLLYAVNYKARYYMKFSIYAIWCMLAATLPIPLMLPWPRDYRNAYIPASLCRMVSRFIGISWIVRGQENIVKNSGAVMLINHQSALDLTILAILWPLVGRCTVISKREIFYIWPFGLASYLWGTLFIDRKNRTGATKAVNDTAQAINRKHAKLCMFPEGTRHSGSELLQFKKGAFYVAITNQCPIQPIVVSRYHFLNCSIKKFSSGFNIITILPAIPTQGLTLDNLDDLIEKTHQTMSRYYKQTSQEVENLMVNIY